MQDPGLIPPPDEVLRLLPAGLALGGTYAISRFLTRIPVLAGIVAALAPVVGWWVGLYTTRVLPPFPPTSAGERTAWALPLMAVVVGASIAWRPHDDNDRVPRRAAALGLGTFALRALAMGAACMWVLKTFLARDDESAVAVWVPWALGAAIAAVQQLAIVGAARCGGWLAIGTVAFAVGHLGPICLTYEIASNAQLAGLLGIGLGLCVTASWFMPGRKAAPGLVAAAVGTAGLLAVNQHYLAPEPAPLAVWPLIFAAAVTPALAAFALDRRVAAGTMKPWLRSAIATGACVALTIAAVGYAILAKPTEPEPDPDDPAALYEQYR